jgi:hypothetical protein
MSTEDWEAMDRDSIQASRDNTLNIQNRTRNPITVAARNTATFAQMIRDARSLWTGFVPREVEPPNHEVIHLSTMIPASQRQVPTDCRIFNSI